MKTNGYMNILFDIKFLGLGDDECHQCYIFIYIIVHFYEYANAILSTMFHNSKLSNILFLALSPNISLSMWNTYEDTTTTKGTYSIWYTHCRRIERKYWHTYRKRGFLFIVKVKSINKYSCSNATYVTSEFVSQITFLQ